MTITSEPDLRRAQPPRRRRLRRSWGQRLLITFGALTSAALLLVAAVLGWGLRRYQAITFVDVPNVTAVEASEPQNWLLVGVDTREGIDPNDPNAAVFVGGEHDEGKRTDTIIIARVDPTARTVDLLSVPRDLWVPISGSGESGRINSAFSGEGGQERLVSTINDVLDIPINNYAEVNFVGFQDVIDALGGVPVWFDNPVRDMNSGLNVETPGCHMLDGFDALAFARSRHLEYEIDGRWVPDTSSDYGRSARQQFLMAQVADQASNSIDLTDLGTLDAVLRAGGSNLLIDNGSGANDLISLARTFSSVGSDGIRNHALPVTDRRTSGGADVLDLQVAEAQPVLDIFRGTAASPDFPSEERVDPATVNLVVQNGAGIGGLAASTSTDLGELGFVVDEVGDAEDAETDTVILYPDGSEAEASEIGRALTTAPLFKLDPTATEITLVLGADFQGVGPAAADPNVVNDPAADHAELAIDEVGIAAADPKAGTACA
ncbi:MAG: LCP family protein [Acidimicrobiales bacterium]